MTETLLINGVVMPSPVQIAVGNEIIWSANTGRTSSGLMVGDVVAEKKTLTIEWGILTDQEYKLIQDNLIPGFIPIKFHDAGSDITIQGYRGSLTGKQLGYIGDGIFYYKSAAVQITQQ